MNDLTKTPENAPANGCVSRATYVAPRANIVETPDAFLLEADLPGVAKEGLELTVEDGELEIVGRRSAVAPQSAAVYRESLRADFRRVFELGASVDANRIEARLEHGVLRLTLPKAEASKPRRITIAD